MDRLWVFQSDRAFTELEINQISNIIKQHLAQWNAHGIPLEGGFSIRYNQFIIVNVNENQSQASGCSIDSLTRVIQRVEKDFDLSLLNRMNIAFIEEGAGVNILPLKDFKQAVKKGEINSEAVVFNNAVSNLADFNKNWEVKLKNSWVKHLVK